MRTWEIKSPGMERGNRRGGGSSARWDQRTQSAGSGIKALRVPFAEAMSPCLPGVSRKRLYQLLAMLLGERGQRISRANVHRSLGAGLGLVLRSPCFRDALGRVLTYGALRGPLAGVLADSNRFPICGLLPLVLWFNGDSEIVLGVLCG